MLTEKQLTDKNAGAADAAPAFLCAVLKQLMFEVADG